MDSKDELSLGWFVFVILDWMWIAGRELKHNVTSAKNGMTDDEILLIEKKARAKLEQEEISGHHEDTNNELGNLIKQMSKRLDAIEEKLKINN